MMTVHSMMKRISRTALAILCQALVLSCSGCSDRSPDSDPEPEAETTFEYHIIKASVYDNLDNTYKIYACLNNKKRVAIFNFDLNNCKLEKSDTEIIKSGFGFGHFKKAIQLPNELVATSDDDNEIDI